MSRPSRRLRLIASVLGGLFSGALVTLVSQVLIHGFATTNSERRLMFGFWPLVWGVSTLLVATACILAWSPGTLGDMRRMRVVAASALGLGVVATTWWIIMWGFSPFTLEGVWLYAVAFLAALFCAFLVRGARRVNSRRR